MKKSLLAAAAATGSVLLTAHGAGAMTYTLEPGDFDGVIPGININLTQQQLGGTLCPCTKIPYPADYVSNQQGVTAITETPLMPGDTVLGYSLGSVAISTYLADNTPPPGVNFILLGNTSSFNGLLAATGLLPLFGGIPADTPNPVTSISRQYDGWADLPNNMLAPGYLLAMMNAMQGELTVHIDYTAASLLNNPANVTWTQGNITYELVPTQNLPIDQGWRDIGLGFVADALDRVLRPLIDAAYTNRPNPTAAQLAASAGVQAKSPPPSLIPGPPEPVVTLNPPLTPSISTPSPNAPTRLEVTGTTGPGAQGGEHTTSVSTPEPTSMTASEPRVDSIPLRSDTAPQPVAADPKRSLPHIARKPIGSERGGHQDTQTTAGSNATDARSAKPGRRTAPNKATNSKAASAQWVHADGESASTTAATFGVSLQR